MDKIVYKYWLKLSMWIFKSMNITDIIEKNKNYPQTINILWISEMCIKAVYMYVDNFFNFFIIIFYLYFA